jgi:hypothetical protein
LGKLDDDLIDTKDYPWLVSLDQALVLCMDHLERARQCQDGLSLGVNLKQASRAMRSALEIYGMRLEKENQA